eukprot:1196019-Prorocentrum_minimum.AAC.6
MRWLDKVLTVNSAVSLSSPSIRGGFAGRDVDRLYGLTESADQATDLGDWAYCRRKLPRPPTRLGGQCHHDGQLGSPGNPATIRSGVLYTERVEVLEAAGAALLQGGPLAGDVARLSEAVRGRRRQLGPAGAAAQRGGGACEEQTPRARRRHAPLPVLCRAARP